MASKFFPEKPDYTSDWGTYESFVEDYPAVITLDLGLDEVAPLESYPYMLFFSLSANQPTPEGFPGPEERESMYQLEDQLIHELGQKLGAIHCGTSSAQGTRDTYFYAPKSDNYEDIVAKLMQRHPDYAFNLDVNYDENWNSLLRISLSG
ncbi:MAG: DUF695 domain-containing protein [Bacteroidia bacterium]|nr:DUF695 domain-containing protein [Bacteroidia bacterium]